MYSQVTKTSTIIQKYGGTSVASVERIKALAARVGDQYRQGWRRIGIVVSAMSGETNRLVELVRQVNPSMPDKHYDMAVAAGEQVSVALVAAAIEAEGIGADAFLAYQLGIVTDTFHSKARIQAIRTERMEESWRQGRIPVIAGFQGVTDSMEITTLGRGGSDTSAVAVAVAVGASFCEINTDVNGVYSADPRIVKNAKLVQKMDYEVALEMASLGSKVLHSRCVEIGAKFGMPITVRNSFQPNHSERTIIVPTADLGTIESPIVSGVTLDKNIVRIVIEGLSGQPGTISKIFEKVADQGANVDIIVHDMAMSQTRNRISFTIGEEDLPRTMRAFDLLKSSGTELDFAQEGSLAKVSIVGVGMRSHSGVASKAFTTLEQAGIPIKMISTSEIKISCVVPLASGETAMQLLHRAFVE